MVDPVLHKLLSFIVSLIQSHHMGHPEVLKHLRVVLRRVAPPILSILVNGAHEGNEFFGNDEVQVPILHLFVVLVLFVVEFAEVVPA